MATLDIQGLPFSRPLAGGGQGRSSGDSRAQGGLQSPVSTPNLCLHPLGFSQRPPSRAVLVRAIFPRSSLKIYLPATGMPTPRLAAAEPSAPRRSSTFPLAAPRSRGGQRGPRVVWLHSEEERVRTYRPGAASAPAMPNRGIGAALERRLLSLAVTAASPRGHHGAVRPTSRSCGHKEMFPPLARAAPRGF